MSLVASILGGAAVVCVVVAIVTDVMRSTAGREYLAIRLNAKVIVET